ncbi:MAG: hypothetical protein WBV62_08035, partial [Roseobacter sp.]
MTMNAQVKEVFDTTDAAPSADAHSGEATGLFTTSMAPLGTDMMCGEGTDLFTTSMAPQGSTMTGTDTGLYTTRMVSGRDALS